MTHTLYQIALTRIPKVGPVTARNLISYCGNVEQVFRESKRALLKIPGVGPQIASQIKHASGIINESERILQIAQDNGVRILFYLDSDFPNRLKHIPDSPLILYGKGNITGSADRVVSIIGTRKPTQYGLSMTEQIVHDLAKFQVQIISGLAYGIDIAAHRASLKYGLSTIGVLGSGIGRIYPDLHRNVAQQMMEQGGLLTEFDFHVKPDRENFPMRNRLIAGLSDAVIVIESGQTGGSMITAQLAHGYHRDIFALPGRVNDRQSAGCLSLIQNHQAQLIRSAADIAAALRWEDLKELKTIQRKIFVELNEQEKLVSEIIEQEQCIEIDAIAALSQFGMSELASVLLSLEFKGVIKALPGKQYQFL